MDAGDDARDEKRDDVGDEPGEKWGGGLGAPPLSGEWGDVGGVPTRRSLVRSESEGAGCAGSSPRSALRTHSLIFASVYSNPNQCSKSSSRRWRAAARPGGGPPFGDAGAIVRAAGRSSLLAAPRATAYGSKLI